MNSACSFLISAFAAHTTGPQQSDTVRVEDIRVDTTRDRRGDPTHRVELRNVGSSTLRRYVVYVWARASVARHSRAKSLRVTKGSPRI